MGRVRAHARRQLIALAAVFALCTAGLFVLHAQTKHRYRLSAAAAIADARANASDRAFLARNPTNHARVIPLDGSLQRVTFFAGAQVVLDAAVDERGEVVAIEQHDAGVPASGASLANAPWLLVLLSAVFLAATTVVPLRRIRNLDALVLASFTVTVPLINARLAGASVICASAALLYLTLRCLAVGLRPHRQPAAPSTPLLAHMCSSWQPRRRTRLLRLLLAATVFIFVTITLTSAGYTDVAAASLQGATELVHGVLPYGHITLALHGDTYPLLNYVLYIPGALWQPVTTAFSSLEGSLATTTAAALLAGLGVHRLAAAPGASHRRPASATQQTRSERDRALRTTLAWFAFPPVLLAASGGANDLLLAACLAWMLALRKHKTWSTLALAMGVWVKLVPLVLAAIWLPCRRSERRELIRACAGAAALSLALTALLIALGGPAAIPAMIKAMAFQFQRGSFFAPWYTFNVQWLQPPVQAAALTIVLLVAVRAQADRPLRHDLVRVSALAAALLLALQLSANYWTWSYLPWVLPPLLVALFMIDGDQPASTNGAAHHARTSTPTARRLQTADAAAPTRQPRPLAGEIEQRGHVRTLRSTRAAVQ
ncbi:MAG TPA: glycosyltransferase 87 family protein [Solirubrobacteraceae bacterium]|nr:glycosyltransferase 87 family protein [Solirubrobacteraceae bacterium]